MKKQIIIGMLSFIYAICIVLGHDIMLNDTIQYSNITVYVRILLWMFLWDGVINLILVLISYCCKKFDKILFNKKFITSDRKFFLIAYTAIIISWLPTYMACYPGLGIYDGPGQLTSVTTHHPIIHTAFIHLCNWIVGVLSWTSWLIPYAMIQMIFMAGCFSYMLLCFKRWKLSLIYMTAVAIWIALFPMNSLMAITTTKDTFFTGIFILLFCELGKMYFNKNYWKERENCILFCSICFLLCAFRNNGVIVLIGSVPFFIYQFKSYWKRILLLMITVIMLFGIYNGPIMNMLNIPQGDKKEALTVVIQPLTRTYHYAGETLSLEEKEMIRKIFGGEQEPWYVSHISDAAKSQFDSEEFFNHFNEYITLYIKLGLKYPNIYLDTWLANTYGNWYPHEILPDPTAYRMYFEFPDKSAEEYGSLLPKYYTFLQDLSRNSSYLQVPGMYLFFCTGIVFWIWSFLFAYFLIRKQYDKIIFCVPSAVLFFTILLGPVALFRYTYPYMIGLFTTIGIAFFNPEKMD